jgi:hypothetical protein
METARRRLVSKQHGNIPGHPISLCVILNARS